MSKSNSTCSKKDTFQLTRVKKIISTSCFPSPLFSLLSLSIFVLLSISLSSFSNYFHSLLFNFQFVFPLFYNTLYLPSYFTFSLLSRKFLPPLSHIYSFILLWHSNSTYHFHTLTFSLHFPLYFHVLFSIYYHFQNSERKREYEKRGGVKSK